MAGALKHLRPLVDRALHDPGLEELGRRRVPEATGNGAIDAQGVPAGLGPVAHHRHRALTVALAFMGSELRL